MTYYLQMKTGEILNWGPDFYLVGGLEEAMKLLFLSHL